MNRRFVLHSISQHVIELLLRMRREMAGNESQITPQIDNLMIIDRTVDSLTPLLSQLTYEGLIDELFTINNSQSSQFSRILELLSRAFPKYTLSCVHNPNLLKSLSTSK